MKRTWSRLLETLIWVRLGQELGTESPAAKAIHDLVEFVFSIPFKGF